MRIVSAVLLVTLILVCLLTMTTFQQTLAFGFVERQQIVDFEKLTGEFVQNVINSQPSPNSEGVGQFRILTAQFENDIINAVTNDHSSLIPGKVTKYAEYFLSHSLEGEDWMPYTQEVLRIFCRSCI
jgi:hypothetical protein